MITTSMTTTESTLQEQPNTQNTTILFITCIASERLRNRQHHITPQVFPPIAGLPGSI